MAIELKEVNMRDEDPNAVKMTKAVLTRRLLVMRGASVAGIGAGLAALPGEAQAQRSGLTDNDPSDGPGRGRGSGGYRTGATDNDPNDGQGQGRGTQRRAVTDNDPRDGAGQGRGGGGRSTGVTDNDPNDGPGRGRGR